MNGTFKVFLKSQKKFIFKCSLNDVDITDTLIRFLGDDGSILFFPVDSIDYMGFEPDKEAE